MIRVCVAGITGWVGAPLASAIEESDDLELVAGVSRKARGERVGDVVISGSVEEALRAPSDVFVDYTSATAVKANALAAIDGERHVVTPSVSKSASAAPMSASRFTTTAVPARGRTSPGHFWRSAACARSPVSRADWIGFFELLLSEDIAESVRGVKDVQNNIRVTR